MYHVIKSSSLKGQSGGSLACPCLACVLKSKSNCGSIEDILSRVPQDHSRRRASPAPLSLRPIPLSGLTYFFP